MDGETFIVLDKTLNDSTKAYIDKVEALLLGWISVCSLLTRSSADPVEDSMGYLHKNTLQYLLHGDWNKLDSAFRAQFRVILHKVSQQLSKTDQEAARRCKLLLKLVHEPWKNVTLHKILHSLSPTENEVCEYICGEGSELLLMRLEVLCEGKCEDLALKLAATLLRHLRNNNVFKKADVDYISDIVLTLLFKFKRNQEIIDKLKNIDLVEGLQLIKRFSGRKTNNGAGFWKFCDKVTEIAAHTILASCMVQNFDAKEKQNLFYELVNEWALIQLPKLSDCLTSLCNMVRKIVQKAESPIHIYIFAQVLHKQLGDQVKPLCIELYIRGFTANINLIEHYKALTDDEKTVKAEILLSNSFLEFSELLQDNIIIRRECLLTAFSLHPTKECFERLEEAAVSCNGCKTADNKDIKNNNGVLDTWTDECENVSCTRTGEHFIEAVSSLNILNSDLLGLAPHLCDDLSTVLCSPRSQTLSWSLGWMLLKKQCEKYRVEYFSKKKCNLELKYLNIDYSQFTTNTNDSQLTKQNKGKKEKITNKEKKVFNNKGPLEKWNMMSSQKKMIDKNIMNYSMQKIDDLLYKDYKINGCSDEVKNGFQVKDSESTTSTGNTENAVSCMSESEFDSKYKQKYHRSKHSFSPNESNDCVYRFNNSPYSEASLDSPKPAEVPPATLADTSYREKLVPLLRSISMNTPKVLLTDIFPKKVKCNSTTDISRNIDAHETSKDILSPQDSFKNDRLLAKYIPGMNSLDLIVPARPEPTVQVVQLPSPNTILQPVSSNSSTAIQTNSNSISIAKPLNETINSQSNEIVTAQTQTQTQNVETNTDTTNNSSLILTTVVNQANISRAHGTDQRHASQISNPVSVNRSQSKPISSESSSTSASAVNVSANSIINVSSYEGSTQVTAHIQRVGQPHKQKLLYDERNSVKSTSTSTVHVPATIQIFEDSTKQGVTSNNSASTGSVYRFVLKDGKILEQYCQSTQNFSLPDVTNDSNVLNQVPQDHGIKLFKKKKEPKKDEAGNSDSAQVPSLPQFHQAFRRQVYQSGSIIEGTPLTSSPRQFSEESVENQKHDTQTSPLSKAVQTVLKDAETTTKQNNEILHEDPSITIANAPSSVKITSGTDIKEEIQVTDLQSPSGVIFTCKVPISLSSNTVLQGKPVTILKPSNSQEMGQRNVQKNETDLKNKDSVIRSNMNALLAAALQNAPLKTITESVTASQTIKQMKVTTTQENKADGSTVVSTKLRMPSPTQKNVRRTPLVQHGVTRFSRPSTHVSASGTSVHQTAPPVVTIPLQSRTVQVLTANINQNVLPNLSKVETRRDSVNQSNEQPSVSSTTLEQLREFESVLEQVTNTSQMKERGNVKKAEPAVVQSSSSSSDFSNSGSPKVNTLFQTSLVGAISDLNSERVSLTFISKSSTSCTNTLISGTSKITATTPVVVVQSCSRQLASPALSIASQNSPVSSPSTPPANSQSKINAKISKPKAKSIGKTTPTATLKVSTLPKPQQKPQEDEQTTQRIYAILDKYAEQLRNSPELKNKPAPRRRSNPPTNPSQSSKRKKSSQSKSKNFSNIPSCSGMEMSPSSEDLRTAGSEDSSNGGINQVTQTTNSPHNRNDEHSNPSVDVSSDVSETAEKDQRLQHRILLADQSASSGRTVIVQDNVQPVISMEGTKVLAGKQLVVGSGATVPLTLSLPGTGNVKQVLFPVPADGRPFVVAKVPKMYRFHQVTMPSGSPLIASAGSGTVLLRQMCLNKSNSTIKQVKLPVVSQISSHMSSQPTVVLPSGSQSFTLSTGSTLDGESLGIALDNTILLNSSSTSSIGFIQQRNVSKPNQSSNIMSNRQVNQTDNTHMSSCSSEMISMKKEDNIKGDSSRFSRCEVDFKSDEVKYSLNNEILSETQTAIPILTTQTSSHNNWTEVLKDVNGGSSSSNKTKEKDGMKRDSMDSKGCDHLQMSIERKNLDESKYNGKEQKIIKQHKLVENNQYVLERRTDLKSGIASQSLSDHWQFNLKLEKVSNTIPISEPLASCLRESEKEREGAQIQQNSSSLTQSPGLKRKVENTIFQIAFKRDKVKLTKDDLMQQRSASALERELRLQKSLSEECEDLGVDKPSTSDLFPEAELLLDPDPLSRDSLQGELFSRAESSSSSLSSPNHSPVFSSKSTNSWKKQKQAILRHKFSYNRTTSPLKKIVLDKVDSSLESTPSNTNSGSRSIVYEIKNADSNFKCISKDTEHINNECVLQEPDITMECNDSDACNFSDVDDQCNETDILDTEGDSDNDFLKKSHEIKRSGTSHTIKEPSELEKSNETLVLSRLSSSPFNKCGFYLNKESLLEKKNEPSPWFQMMKGIQKDTDKEDSEIDKSNNESGEDISESQNGVLGDFEEQQDTITTYSSSNALQCRKRKKVGLFLGSQSEDSGSSLDTILTGSDSCSGFHSNSCKRSSLRGRTKKGCPCFNGSPEPTKKKKDTPVLDKTDKPCSTKSFTSIKSAFPFNNKKTLNKNTVKLLNRKR